MAILKVSRVILSFRYFKGILIVLEVLGFFFFFLGHFRGFGHILVILEV